jgi:hypothetical protein
LGLGRASPAPALALELELDFAGESAEEARRRCGDGDGFSRGAAAAAPAATMAFRSRGISPVVLGVWGLGVSFRFKMGGAEPTHGTAAEVEWEPSENMGEEGWGWVRPSQGQKGKSGRNKGPVSSSGGGGPGGASGTEVAASKQIRFDAPGEAVTPGPGDGCRCGRVIASGPGRSKAR